MTLVYIRYNNVALLDFSIILFQGTKKKLLKSGKSAKSTPTKGTASFADLVDDDTALQQVL